MSKMKKVALSQGPKSGHRSPERRKGKVWMMFTLLLMLLMSSGARSEAKKTNGVEISVSE